MSGTTLQDSDVIMPLEMGDRLPAVRTIQVADLFVALERGWADFKSNPTHAVFLAIIYPVVGLILARAALGYDFIPLLYPLASGFALVGPFAALGLYELSRRREMGRDTSWHHVGDVTRMPTFGSILLLGALLIVIFFTWIATADQLYVSAFGHRNVTSLASFVQSVLATPQGLELMIVGNIVGALFAFAVLALSVVSFPLLLDRNVSFAVAIATSLKAVGTNPLVLGLWGLIVAVLLALAALPFLLGLAVVLPVLGHATWHLYRALIAPDPGSRPPYQPGPRYKRFGAQFPASLFVSSRIREDD